MASPPTIHEAAHALRTATSHNQRMDILKTRFRALPKATLDELKSSGAVVTLLELASAHETDHDVSHIPERT